MDNAQYQLERIMPTARENGCICKFSKDDFEDYNNGKWTHDENCPSPKYENLPNAGRAYKVIAGVIRDEL